MRDADDCANVRQTASRAYATVESDAGAGALCRRPAPAFSRECVRGLCYFVGADACLRRVGVLYADFFFSFSDAYSSESGPNCASTCTFTPSIAL